MKLFYFNDTFEHQHVYVNTFHSIPKILPPSSGDLFDIEIKENYVPFIKVWDSGSVLLSIMYIKEEKP